MHMPRNITLTLLFGGAPVMTQSNATAGGTVRAGQDQIRLHAVSNNLPYNAGLQTGSGFTRLIEGLGKVILFDTGGDGGILLSNMQRLGLDAGAVEAVMHSHIHGDHTGGLDTFLARNPDVTVYMPESFPTSFQQQVVRLGAAIETASGPRPPLDSVHSTGEMNHGIKEQVLILDTPYGLVVITSCTHPNVADMAEQTKAYPGKDITLLIGGFHLGGRSDAEIRAIIQRLKALASGRSRQAIARRTMQSACFALYGKMTSLRAAWALSSKCRGSC
jgi:7,8-dihydropterin-6-yl-methyl-4-(beta-D-ribofuranosyl)aminobenzene 5'-phosphate synthase